MPFFSAIMGGLIAGAASIYTAKMMLKEQRFDAAVSKFRATVVYELNGLYPATQLWSPESPEKIAESFPRVISAATEFEYYVREKKHSIML